MKNKTKEKNKKNREKKKIKKKNQEEQNEMKFKDGMKEVIEKDRIFALEHHINDNNMYSG